MKKLYRMLICVVTIGIMLTGCRAKEQSKENVDVSVSRENAEEAEHVTVAPTPLPTVTPTESLTPTVTPTETPTPTIMPPEELQAEAETTPESLSVADRIQSGDFSCLDENGVVDRTRIEGNYEGAKKRENHEWVQYDLNGDGMEDLIWQLKNGEMSPITAIYACYEDYARCIYWDEADYTYYLFFSSTENLIRYSGGADFYAREYFGCYEYDLDWNLEFVYGLMGYRIYGFEDWDREEWIKEHPEMGEPGIYFTKVTEVRPDGTEDEELLEHEEFFEMFWELTGFAFDFWGLDGSVESVGSYFFAEGIDEVTYHGFFNPLNCRSFRQDIALRISVLQEYEDGTLYTLMLDQLDLSGVPEVSESDYITMGADIWVIIM